MVFDANFRKPKKPLKIHIFQILRSYEFLAALKAKITEMLPFCEILLSIKTPGFRGPQVPNGSEILFGPGLVRYLGKCPELVHDFIFIGDPRPRFICMVRVRSTTWFHAIRF